MSCVLFMIDWFQFIYFAPNRGLFRLYNPVGCSKSKLRGSNFQVASLAAPVLYETKL